MSIFVVLIASSVLVITLVGVAFPVLGKDGIPLEFPQIQISLYIVILILFFVSLLSKNNWAVECLHLGSSSYLATVYHPIALVLDVGKLCKPLIITFLLCEKLHWLAYQVVYLSNFLNLFFWNVVHSYQGFASYFLERNFLKVRK